MNKKLILRLLGSILLIESAAMAPSLLIALIYRNPHDAPALALSMLLLVLFGLPMRLLGHKTNQNLRAREGFLAVALAWILLAVFGALPFVFSGMLPRFEDAFFEAVSGFTTTGATVTTSFDALPHGVMFWRSFTHWIGGMGVLVLTLALLPHMSGRTSHLVRAESPGPTLSKIVPKMGDTAKILYTLYAILTLLEFFVLMLAGMNAYDAAIHAMGTAGTGGFSNYGASIAAFNNPLIEWIITIFMVLFGINFVLYFKLLTGAWRDFTSSEETKWFLSIFVIATLILTVMLLPTYGNISDSLRYAAFQVASIISTTGFATADYNLWPEAAKMLIVVIMFIGSCAGSTAGGMKVCRIGMLCKHSLREVRRVFQPRKVQVVRFEGKAVDETVLHQVSVFAFVYVTMILLGAFLLSLDGRYDVLTNFTASLTCMSNVGPGLSKVGPVENFAGYSTFSKYVMSFLMLAGRLELFPILALFHPAIWRKQ